MDYTDEHTEDISQTIVNEPNRKYGSSMDRSEWNFKFQLIKGRIAENLVQELFLSEGYQVFKHGIENNLPYLLQHIKSINSPQAISLRIAPDLIIYDPELKKVHYVEVKYCSNGSFTLSQKIDVARYIECFPETIFFIVSKSGIFEVGIDRFIESKRIDLTDSKYLISKNSIFNLRPKVIEQFATIANRLMSNIPKNL